MNIDALNAAMKKYPVSFTDENGDSIQDKGWAYGVWYCGTSFTKVKLYGQYPPTFLKRALAPFPDAKDVLHAPSGSLVDLPGGHVTLDMYEDDVRKPLRAIAGRCPSRTIRSISFCRILRTRKRIQDSTGVQSFQRRNLWLSAAAFLGRAVTWASWPTTTHRIAAKSGN